MRNEHEMMELILNTARADSRIRAVYMNGSRVNPNVEKDDYRDYDIVYVVDETKPFLENKDWILKFGEPAMIQEPDSNNLGWGIGHDFTRSYGWLMLFKDGNRIDLHICIKEFALEDYFADTLTLRLLDKDSILPPLPKANDSCHWIKYPTKPKYDGCCNEFWWCLNNVVKGIARDQIPYALRMYMETVHAELDKMVEWHIAMNNSFSVATGMWGKYFRKYLTEELYEMYLKTYCSPLNYWDAIFTACELFRRLAAQVGDGMGYVYNRRDDENMTEYLNNIKADCEI